MLAAAFEKVAACGHNLKTFDVMDKGRHLKAAPMNVGGESAAERKAIGAGLLLADAPRVGTVALRFEKVINDLGPLRAGLGFEDAVFAIEIEDAIHAAQIEMQIAGAELLSAHGMTAAGAGDFQIPGTRDSDGSLQVLRVVRRLDFADTRPIEL